jgi:hypothetical protein
MIIINIKLSKQERKAKLEALRAEAAKGFDELDQGKGILVKGKKGLAQFMAEIEAEAGGNRQ